MDGLDVSYGGPSQLTAQATGEDFNVEEGEGKRPFRALLDVGLVALQLETEFLVP